MSGDVDGRGRAGPHRPGRGRQHHQGDHQGHRDRDRRARGDRAVRLVPRRRCDAGARRGRRETLSGDAPCSLLDRSQPERRSSAWSSAPRWCSSSPAWRSTRCPARPGAVVFEVRRQFREHPGIMDYTEQAGVRPRRRHLHQGLAARAGHARPAGRPGADRRRLRPRRRPARRASSPARSRAGTLMAVFLANSGGAWDNAKKLVEDGHHGGKGSRGPRGDGHRRHRRRPVQGHRRPGDQPAAQGDEPGRRCSSPRRSSTLSHRRRRERRRPATASRVVAALIIVGAVLISKRRSIAVGADESQPSGTRSRRAGARSRWHSGVTTTARAARPTPRREADRGRTCATFRAPAAVA